MFQGSRFLQSLNNRDPLPKWRQPRPVLEASNRLSGLQGASTLVGLEL
jgi:hypothetical protein